MNSDHSRYQAITTFHCAKCGEQLRLSYNPEKKPKEAMEAIRDQPTGADMLHTKISVWPCVQCMRTGKDAVEAFSKLMGLAAEMAKK